MASIATPNNISIMSIRAFLGLNENPDGDTTLKHGELAEMRNFRITQDKHLQIRPGAQTLLNLQDILMASLEEDEHPPMRMLYGVWAGTVGGTERLLAAYGGSIFDIDVANKSASICGKATEAQTTFFGFGGKVYLLNGHDYMSWDGSADSQFANVSGYIPLVQTATTPQGDGTLLENVNRLTAKRRVQFSPDGAAKTFQLPEKDIGYVSSVKLNGNVYAEQRLAIVVYNQICNLVFYIPFYKTTHISRTEFFGI